MKDLDSKSLEALYESVKVINEDEAGRPFPYYGSDAAATSTAVMGTEPLTQTEVEIPKEAGKESEHDAEDDDTSDNLLKALDSIKDTIKDYEDKKQLRFNKELEESTLNEGILGAIGAGAKAVGKGIANTAKFAGNVLGGAAKAVASGDPTKYALKKLVGNNSISATDLNGKTYLDKDGFKNIHYNSVKDGKRYIFYGKDKKWYEGNPNTNELIKIVPDNLQQNITAQFNNWKKTNPSQPQVQQGQPQVQQGQPQVQQGQPQVPTIPTDKETIKMPSGVNTYDAKTNQWLLANGKPNPAQGQIINAWKKSKGIA